MRVVFQNTANPSQVLFAFDDIIRPGVQESRWAVAYVSERGSRLLNDQFVRRLGAERWREVSKMLVTSFDYGITDPEALRYLRDQVGFSVLISNPEIIETPGLRPSSAFHAKSYFVWYDAHSASIVGSANLTEAALVSNTEIVAVLDEIPTASCLSLWDGVIAGAVALSDQLLDRYRVARARLPPPPVETDNATEADVRIARIGTLWDSIESGVLAPERYDRLWVQAGTMSSGASNSQLELPRGANRFFGFHFDNYGARHETIGYPQLISGPRSWTHRPLVWHGGNGMERLNLPTRPQGGFAYASTAILFRRLNEGFELSVAPWRHPSAIAWRRASQTCGKLYRLGGKSNRVCGLF